MNSIFKKISTVSIGLFAVMPLFSQTQPEKGFSVVSTILTASPDFTYIISSIGVIVLVLSIVKFYQLYIKERFDAKNFYLKLKGYIRNNQYDEAIKVSSNFKNTTIGSIFWIGLLAFNDARKSGKKGRLLKDTLQDSFDEAGLQLIPKIESGIYWFDILAQIATLLGLLGTIFGLINAFHSLGSVDQTMKQVALTNGIYQAMGTTAFGLIIAVPTMLLKGLFQGRSEKIINKIDEYSVKTINQINHTIED